MSGNNFGIYGKAYEMKFDKNGWCNDMSLAPVGKYFFVTDGEYYEVCYRNHQFPENYELEGLGVCDSHGCVGGIRLPYDGGWRGTSYPFPTHWKPIKPPVNTE